MVVVNLLNDTAAAPGVCCCATPSQLQKQQDQCLKSDLPDSSQLSSQLQQEWHPDNNAVVGDILVKPNSGTKVMWSCPHCPAGCPHVWKTSVFSRTGGSKCPYCEGRKLCQHNSLATKAPRQVKYWNQDKNAKTSEQMLAGSRFRAAWKCPTCSHEWQAQVARRTKQGSGCPRCSQSHKRLTSHPTFEAAEHELLLEWDYERNPKDSIFPYNTTLASQKRVHWVCQKCPKGQLHRYRSHASARAGKNSVGCPYCAGKQVCECNSLQAHYPVISSEWDYARNDMAPADVTSRSDQVVWWKNDGRGSWLQCIAQRTDTRGKPKH